MNFKKVIWGIFIGLGFCSCGNRNQQGGGGQPPQEYPTTVVTTQEVTLASVYPAVIRGQEDIEIRPRIDGFIDAIYIDEGSVVRKGQALFKINSPQAEQGYAAAQAALNSAEANLNTAKLDVERMRPLADKKIISNVQLQSYENRYAASQAAYAQAQATLSQAQATLGWVTVTSPVDGVAGSIPFRQGSLVNSTNILTTIANTNNVFAYFTLNEKELIEFLNSYEGTTQAEKIRNMPPVTLTLADGTVYPENGKIETIAGLVNTTTGSTNFRAEFPNRSGMLRSGTSGKISVPRILENTIMIPQKATFAQQDKTLVYKVQADSVVQTLISILPTPDGHHYAVTEGLSDGDRIVTDGVATLSNGKKIRVAD